MVGYLKIHKPEMKVKEYETYRAFYCSLCHVLGRRYGFGARLLLSYDLTILAIFAACMQNASCPFAPTRCPVNPTKKCKKPALSFPALEWAADLTVIISFFKLQDTLQDSGFWKRTAARLLRPYLSLLCRKARKFRPEEYRQTALYMARQFRVECAPQTGLDEAAEPTGAFLSYIASQCAPENQRKAAGDFGYFLGRTIYLADAFDDLQKDLKRGNFNPFIQAYHITAETLPQRAGDCRRALDLTVSEAIDRFDALETGVYSEILDNLVRLGLFAEIDRIYSKYQEVTA